MAKGSDSYRWFLRRREKIEKTKAEYPARKFRVPASFCFNLECHPGRKAETLRSG
jgi:hypothetical protein